MLAFIPVFLLVIGAFAIVILHLFRRGLGFTWLIAALAVVVSWVLSLIIHWIPVNPVILAYWIPPVGNGSSLAFQLDQYSWPYYFSLASLGLAVIFTATIRFRVTTQINPWAWGGTLVFMASGMIAVMSASPLAFILSWTLIDLLELVYIIRSKQRDPVIQVVFPFSSRLIGTLAIGLAMVVSQGNGQVMALNNYPPEAGTIILMAAGLRLGVIPLNIPSLIEPKLRRGVGTMLRLVSPATSLVILARLPETVVPPNLAPYFLVFTTLASLYGAGMWAFARDEISGRQYWLIAFASMAVSSAIRGRPLASLSWGMVMVMAGGFIFLYSARKTRWIGLLGSIFALAGLPFSPAASGWEGLVVLPFNLLDILSIIGIILLVFGTLKHVMKPGDPISEQDSWVRVIYSMGLILLWLSHIITGVIGWKGSFVWGNWWASSLTVLIAIGAYARVTHMRRLHSEITISDGWTKLFYNRGVETISELLSLRWFYSLLGIVFGWAQRAILFFSSLLEGQGGILWALLLLVLLGTLLLPQSQP